jgi:hypothetical protein
MPNTSTPIILCEGDMKQAREDLAILRANMEKLQDLLGGAFAALENLELALIPQEED